MKSFVSFLFILLVASFILFGAEVKVGVCLPFTGEGKIDAENAWKAFILANEQMPSVGDYRVILLKKDDQTEPKITQKVTQELIDEGAMVLVGYPWSSLAIAGAAIAEKAKIPMVSTWSTNPLTTQGKKYVSRACFIDPFQGEVAAKFLVKRFGVKKTVVIADRTQPYCTGLATYFKKAFIKLKGKVLASLYIKQGDPLDKLKSVSKKALSYDPDAIFVTAYGRDLGSMVKILRNLGYDGILITGDTGGTSDVKEYAGDSVNGLYFTDHFNVEAAKSKTAEKFVSSYREKYGVDPGAGAALAYDVYLIVYNAIKSCVENGKEVNPENINYYIRHTKNLEAVTGVITINPVTGNPTKSAVVNLWEDGKVKLCEVVTP